MLILGSVLLAALSFGPVAGSQSRIVGRIPASFDGATRVAWIAVDAAGDDVRCGITATAEWLCDGVSHETRGVVVLAGGNRIGAVAVGLSPIDEAETRWGRLVRITAGGASPDDLRGLTIAAYRPERPLNRMQSRRYQRVKDIDIHVSKLSDTMFWIGGFDVDPDGVVVLEGPLIGSRRLATRHLPEGPPDEPVYLSAVAPAVVNGRVLDARGNPVDDAQVDLWDLVQLDVRPARLDDNTPMVHRASVTTSSDGAFQLEHLDDAIVLITAFHRSLGVGRIWVTESRPTIDLELMPPTRATGRVLKRSLPVVGARVRFFPDADAFASSADPMTLVAAEVLTSDDGSFSLALPPNRAGSVLVDLDDGSRARVAVPAGQTKGDIVLGDVAVPDGSHLTVRLLDGPGCSVAVVGPLGALGMTIVRATSLTTVYELDLPESGTWNLNAECGDRTYTADPAFVVVRGDRATTTVDARVVKSTH
jgi:hypothetical protein